LIAKTTVTETNVKNTNKPIELNKDLNINEADNEIINKNNNEKYDKSNSKNLDET
jgi:hypothetical protein